MALKENYTFKSTDERGTTIHAVKWTPENGDIKAAIQLNHGMIEYIERYSEFAEYLADRGFVVMGHDHIGHGESVETHDDWGIIHTGTPSDTLVEDMFTNYKIIKDQYPDVPFFIFGHSMGSYLLRKFLCTKAPELKGVNGAIICGTGTTEAFNKYKEAGIRDVTLKLFPGDRHEILQETDRADVFAFLFDWMTQRM